MISFTLQHVGSYTRPERHRQTIPSPWLVLNISGMEYVRLCRPDGALLEERTGPHLALGLPGMISDFAYGSGRENWVLMFREFPIRLAGHSFEIRDQDHWLPVPFSVSLSAAEVTWARSAFERIRDLLKSPLPNNILLARIEVLQLLTRFIKDQPLLDPSGSPAHTLRQLLDNDLECTRNLAQLSEECGYSADHLRILFTEQFGIGPAQYRLRQRMGKVVELMAEGTETVKQIAAAAGFRHSSHLCKAFKDMYGISPAEGIRRYRYGKR